jgi:AbrB family looped-hinge helix DNA binding protein
MEARVSSKGQITLPKSLRETLRVRRGDRIFFTTGSDGSITLRKRKVPGSSAGVAKELGQPLPAPLELDDIDDAIDEAIAERHPDRDRL